MEPPARWDLSRGKSSLSLLQKHQSYLTFIAHLWGADVGNACTPEIFQIRSEEHTSELQSLMRNSYAVFCLKKKKNFSVSCTNTQAKHDHISGFHLNLNTINNRLHKSHNLQD